MKPMLAVEYEESKLTYPCIASPKLDGVRGLIHNGALLSRSLKAIPNKYVSALLSDLNLNGLDGELVVGSPTDKQCYSNTVSNVMAIEKKDFEFTYYVFDIHDTPETPYVDRASSIQARMDSTEDSSTYSFISILESKLINSEEELLEYEQEKLAQGYEGLILRSPSGKYKYGRSTVREGYLLKVKRFSDSEAIIVGFEEELKNNNPKQPTELGRSKRSSHRENKVGKGTLGALLVTDCTSKVGFRIGTGLDDALREEIWDNMDTWLGKTIKYKYFVTGMVDKPRHPVYLGVRHEYDL